MAGKRIIVPDPVVILNDVYQVTLDSRCLILQKKATNEDTDLSKEEQKAGIRNLGYFSTWEHIGNYLVKELTREKAKKDEKIYIEQYISTIKESNKEITEMFKKLDDEGKFKLSKK